MALAPEVRLDGSKILTTSEFLRCIEENGEAEAGRLLLPLKTHALRSHDSYSWARRGARTLYGDRNADSSRWRSTRRTQRAQPRAQRARTSPALCFTHNPNSRSQQSKRVPLTRKYNIAKKVKEKERKARRDAKKK